MYANQSVYTPDNIGAYSNVTRFMNPVMYGTYTVSTSPGGKNAYFVRDGNSNTFFESPKNAYSMNANTYGQYVGNAVTTCFTSPTSKVTSNVPGEWIEFGLPSNVAVNLIGMRPMITPGWAPDSVAFCGGVMDSKSNMSWYLISTASNIQWSGPGTEVGLSFNGNETIANYAYKYWRIIDTRNSSNVLIGDVSRFALSEIRLIHHDRYINLTSISMGLDSARIAYVRLYTPKTTITSCNLVSNTSRTDQVAVGTLLTSNLDEMTPYSFTLQALNTANVPGTSFTVTGTTVTPSLSSFTASTTGTSNVVLRVVGAYDRTLVTWSNNANTSFGTSNVVNPSTLCNLTYTTNVPINGLTPNTTYAFTATPYSTKGFAGSNRQLVLTTSTSKINGAPSVAYRPTIPWTSHSRMTLQFTQQWCDYVVMSYVSNGVASNITVNNPVNPIAVNYITVSNLSPPASRFTFTITGFVGGVSNNSMSSGSLNTYMPVIHNFNAMSQFSSNVVLGWKPLCCDYTVITLNNSNISGNLESNVNTFTYSNVSPGSNYTFSITPYSSTGFAGCNVSLTVSATPAILDVYTSGVTPTSAVVNWNAKFVDYVVVSWSNNGVASSSPAIYAPTSNYSISNLINNTQSSQYTVAAYTGSNTLVGVLRTSNVIPLYGLVGWYDGDSFGLNGTSNWFNKVPGSNITNVGSNVKKATSNWSYVYGTSNDAIVFPTNQMTPSYSLFYMGRVSSNLGGWLTASNNSQIWYQGWWGGASGLAYRSNLYSSSASAPINISPAGNVHGNDWFVGCDINAPCLFRTNGVTRSYDDVPIHQRSAFTMAINTAAKNSFQAAEFIIYDRTLSMDEVYAVEGFMRSKYLPPVLQSLSAAVVANTVTLNWGVAPSNCDYIDIYMQGQCIASNVPKTTVSYMQSNVPLDTTLTFTVMPYMNGGFCLSNYSVTVNT